MSFDPAEYGPALTPLLAIDRRCSLDEGRPNVDALPRLEKLTPEGVFGPGAYDRPMAACCLSAVWLLHNFLDQSHTFSQSIPTSEGSFWHGVMHRREGDFSNAKYWFRRVGDHPVYEELAARFGDWDPFDFVDRCQSALRTGRELDECLEAQQAEWEALFDWCWQGAKQT